MPEPLSALFVGLGSIGTRHLGNLRALCARDGTPLTVTALRSSERPLPSATAKLVDREVSTLPAGERFSLAFLTNPTHLHAQALAQLRGRVDAFFIEKPIFDTTSNDLAALGLAPPQKAYVAAPMRFTALFPALKEQLQRFAPYCARVICSSYLPGWRSGTDYRDIYSAKKEMGGGVSLDLIHEWDYLYDLFGPPQRCYNLRGHYSHLEVSSDDLSLYIAEYPGLLCEVHLDYFGREYRRTAEFFCRDGSLLANFGTGVLTLPNGTTLNYSEDANQRYLREMEHFLHYAQGPYIPGANPPALALQVLATALGTAP